MSEKMYQKNDLLELFIEDIGSEGEGIGHIDGYTLFVKDAILGDKVCARIVKPKKNYAYARLEKVIEPSLFRVNARCEFSRQCGGCQIQTLSYEKQLEMKQNKVFNNMVRIGGFSESFLEKVFLPIVGMEKPWNYRNKAQYPIGYDREGNLVTGFYAGRTHQIIPNLHCNLEPENNGIILQTILSFMKDYHISAYDEQLGKGLVRHVLIRKGFYTGEIMVCLVINGINMPEEKELIRRLTNLENLSIVSISISSNVKDTNVIMGNTFEVLYGQSYITDKIGDISFQISPLSFFQVNPIQTQKLYSLALEYAQLTGKETVWDLYCGIGSISLFLAQRAGRVYGVEIIPQAIENAKVNARINNIRNTEFFVGKAEEVLPDYYESRGIFAPGGEYAYFGEKDDSSMKHPDVIVVDPPRKGCDELCINTMLEMNPQKIVYVSCDSATLARDLKLLCEGGYQIEKIRPVDMFPHTVHVETVVLLSKGVVDKDNFRKVKVDFSLEDMDLTELRGR